MYIISLPITLRILNSVYLISTFAYDNFLQYINIYIDILPISLIINRRLISRIYTR